VDYDEPYPACLVAAVAPRGERDLGRILRDVPPTQPDYGVIRKDADDRTYVYSDTASHGHTHHGSYGHVDRGSYGHVDRDSHSHVDRNSYSQVDRDSYSHVWHAARGDVQDPD
jgi:hypothetical protein